MFNMFMAIFLGIVGIALIVRSIIGFFKGEAGAGTTAGIGIIIVCWALSCIGILPA